MLIWNIADLSRPQNADEDAMALLPVFAAELLKASAAFREATVRDDLTEVVRLCHRIRGSAALYGFKNFAEKLGQAEKLMLAGHLAPFAVAPKLAAVANGIGRFSGRLKVQ